MDYDERLDHSQAGNRKMEFIVLGKTICQNV